MSVRTLHRWQHGRPRRCGRPRRPDAVVAAAYARVAEEWQRQGRGAGWRPVARALPDLPVDLVQEGVRRAKRDHRAAHRRHLEAARVSTTVHGRDVMWALDATHLGRVDGEAVEALVLIDVGSKRTLAVSVGFPANAAEVVALLDDVRRVRGSLALVLNCDNAPAYVAEALHAYAAAHDMVVLHSKPGTPTDNAAVERRCGEIKVECDLGKGVVLRDAHEPLPLVEEACRRLDACRLRATHGYRTAVDVDDTLPRVDDPRARARLASEARRAMDKAVQGRSTLRAQRQAQRAAVLNLLQEKNLITRTRGDGSPVTVVPDMIP
jgi:transposase InsO family protein